MKTTTLVALSFFFAASLSHAESQALFFAKETDEESTRIALNIMEDGEVYGTKLWQPNGEHGAWGTITGKVNGDLIDAVYDYSIEGSEQSEQMVFKIDGDKLLVGEGELEEGKDGRLNLKDPDNIDFTTALKKVKVSEPKPGTPERKAIMDSMRVEVSDYAGKPVTFTGKVISFGNWARFLGHVAPTDGKPVDIEGIAADMELDFFALLMKDEDGNWETVHWGFAGDTSVIEEAEANFPDAPWPLFEWIE